MMDSGKQRYLSPIPPGDVDAILERAVAQLGKSCHLWPVMELHQKTRPDGWVSVGSIGEMASGQAYQVWFHRETGEGRLHAFEMVEGGGVRPRRFEG